MPTTHDASFLFIELGLVVVGLALLARLVIRWGFSAIPFSLSRGSRKAEGVLFLSGSVKTL
jgi:hypothetical protein